MGAQRMATANDDRLDEVQVIDLRDGTDTAVAPTAGAPLTDRQHRQWRIAGVAVLALLNVADLVTTDLFMDAGVPEGNPVAHALMGTGTHGIAKAALLVALAVLVLRRPPRIATTCALWTVVGVYVSVVAVNLMVLNAVT